MHAVRTKAEHNRTISPANSERRRNSDATTLIKIRLPTLSFDGQSTVLDVPRDYSEGEELVDSPQEKPDGLLIFNDPDESGSELRKR